MTKQEMVSRPLDAGAVHPCGGHEHQRSQARSRVRKSICIAGAAVLFLLALAMAGLWERGAAGAPGLLWPLVCMVLCLVLTHMATSN